MSPVFTIMRKELRAYFLSPVALIFLSIFLVASFALFFRVEDNVFIRNLVDVRPLFRSLPILLVFLVSAITMKQWSEEQKLGTLEILLTLPLKSWQLVLGKFMAGWVLCLLALLLTVSLPVTVSFLGDLDWGPVLGGYLGAALLSAAYLSIGLCVSARTDNQIVALMLTLVVGGLFYIVGSATVTELVGPETAETLRALGTGSRFESVERGLLDLRDLIYFGSLTAFFLTLNVFFLELKRMDSQPKSAETMRTPQLIGLMLVGLNVLLLNAWVQPISFVRMDLTQNDDYTISEATKDTIESLREPLQIQFLYTTKTHEKLKSLIPQVRDMLMEYKALGSDNIQLSFADPFTDKQLEEELTDLYNVKSEPLPIIDQNSRGIANVYFHILVRYGNQHTLLSFRDLVESHLEGRDYKVRLRNLEYDLTSAIQTVTQGFQSVDALLQADSTPIRIKVFLSSAGYPESMKEIPPAVEKAASSIAEKTGGQLTIEVLDPSNNPGLQDEVRQKYGIQALSLGMFSEEKFWSFLVVERGPRVIPTPLVPELLQTQLSGDIGSAITGGDIEELIYDFIKRMTPGFRKQIGIATKTSEAPAPNFTGGPPPPPNRDFTQLEKELSSTYDVQLIDLSKNAIPTNIDVLIIGKTGELDAKALYAIDQYLMLGGSVIALASIYEGVPGVGGWNLDKLDDSLLDLLNHYGVAVGNEIVMDEQNFDLPYPVEEQKDGFTIRRIEQIDYPYFPMVTGGGFQEGNLAFKGVKELVVPWANPVRLAAKQNAAGDDVLDERGLPVIELPDGLTGSYLAWTTKDAWTVTEPNIAPDLNLPKESWFAKPKNAKSGRLPLAVNVQGRFKSYFTDRPDPNREAVDGTVVDAEPDKTGRTVLQSAGTARLIAIGSSEILSDKGSAFPFHFTFLQNLIDWSLEDTKLLSIRSAGAFAKTLKETEPKERQRLEWMNYLIVLLVLAAVFGSTYTRRNMTRSIIDTESEGAKS